MSVAGRMKRSPLAGRRRKITDEGVQKIRSWKPLAQLAREHNVSPSVAYAIRMGYEYKQRSP